ncbi:MAG: glycosyltransferase family 39 protein [Actinomycetota bacterium]
MGLSARIFGFSSWSLLVPQALEGVAAVGLLAAAVRRVAGPAAGLIAGAALALTPAAVLIFRFDNPDAFLVLLLVLLLVAAAYCVTRALESARTWWLAAAAGWWILAVLLRLAADRPYTGGSTDSNPLELAFGYNGLGPLLGGGGSGAAGSGFGGTAGLQRLFTGEFGLEISWLLPAAVLLLAAGIWLTWGRRRTDPARAGLLVWGGWLVVTAVTFSYMKGTIHPYYTVALAPRSLRSPG